MAAPTRPAHTHREHLLALTEAICTQILDLGLFTKEELSAVVGALKRHLADPRVTVTRPLLFQAWGRKPLAR